MMNIAMIVAVCLVLSLAPFAEAAGKATDLADRYKVPEQEVQQLRDKGMGWGEIDTALAISQKSGKPLSEVMSLRDKGMGWGKIAREYGFKLGDVKGRGHEMRADKADRAAKHEGRGPKEAHGRP